MYELFKTVLILSLFGFGITAILLCLKPVTAKKVSGKMAVLCMGSGTALHADTRI